MKYVYISTIILSVFTLFFSGNKHQKNSSMTIVRGIKPAIADFTSLEQKFVLTVAEKLKNNGFPLSQLTRVHLKNRIHTNEDYYSYNEVTFFINPGVYQQDEFHWGIQNIGVGWEDPSIIRTPDGGIEFEVGRKIKHEDLVLNLYRLEDSYSYGTLLKDHDQILEKINKVLLANDLEEIKYFTSKGIFELINNYLIIVTADSKNNNLYELAIQRIDYDLIDFDHFNELIKTYSLKINLKTSRIEILDSFDPTFFPTPVANPTTPFTKKKN